MTILFLEDWNNYPEAIIDTKTTNTSFIRISALYREMGVANHAFPLQLHNPELQGINPFDPNLTLEQMAAIAVECKNNFFYFIRECVRVPGSGFDNPVHFKANRGNMALYWLFFNHITVMLIQPRQTGKSFGTDTLSVYITDIRSTSTQVNLLTKDDTLRAANLERIKNIDSELPYYLKLRTKDDINNSEEFTVKALGNSYRGHLPNKSPKLAFNVGRGLTSPIFHLDEAAVFFNISISMPAALAAGTAARKLAKDKNEPYGTIITTTAGKKDDKDGFFIYNMLTNSAIWSEKFYDAPNLEELELLVRHNSIKGEKRVNCTFNHRQLGYTDEWLAEVIEECGAHGEDADRDFRNVWTSGSVLSPLTIPIANMIRESEISDFHTQIFSPYSYIVRYFGNKNLIENTLLNEDNIMALDTSDAAGGDDIALLIRNVKTGGIIAGGNYNETNLVTFAEWITKLLVIYPKLTLIIERRSSGAMILDYLLLMLPDKGIDPFTRIYNKVVQEYNEYPDRYKEVVRHGSSRNKDIYTKYKKTFGFATSSTGATSRSELYSTTLNSAAKLTGNLVHDPITINQLLSLTTKNGRVDHADGEKDDMCIAWLLSYWLLSLGQNLQNYGISSRDVLCDNNNSKNNKLDEYDRYEQELLRNQIEALVEEMQSERDQYIASVLETKLRNLSNKLGDNDKEILSVDRLIEQLRERRKHFKHNRR